MKGQNIEKNVDKKNSIDCVKLIRKQEIILYFSARRNVPQTWRKLNTCEIELIIDLGQDKRKTNKTEFLFLYYNG